jgi:hypothetical protein
MNAATGMEKKYRAINSLNFGAVFEIESIFGTGGSIFVEPLELQTVLDYKELS